MPDGRGEQGIPHATWQQVEVAVRQQTDAIRADIENLERICATLVEGRSANHYQIERLREIIDGEHGINARLNEVEQTLKLWSPRLYDLSLIKIIVYGMAGMVLAAFMALLLAKHGWQSTKTGVVFDNFRVAYSSSLLWLSSFL